MTCNNNNNNAARVNPALVSVGRRDVRPVSHAVVRRGRCLLKLNRSRVLSQLAPKPSEFIGQNSEKTSERHPRHAFGHREAVPITSVDSPEVITDMALEESEGSAKGGKSVKQKE